MFRCGNGRTNERRACESVVGRSDRTQGVRKEWPPLRRDGRLRARLGARAVENVRGSPYRRAPGEPAAAFAFLTRLKRSSCEIFGRHRRSYRRLVRSTLRAYELDVHMQATRGKQERRTVGWRWLRGKTGRGGTERNRSVRFLVFLASSGVRVSIRHVDRIEAVDKRSGSVVDACVCVERLKSGLRWQMAESTEAATEAVF